jgi:hypothetical protein
LIIVKQFNYDKFAKKKVEDTIYFNKIICKSQGNKKENRMERKERIRLKLINILNAIEQNIIILKAQKKS